MEAHPITRGGPIEAQTITNEAVSARVRGYQIRDETVLGLRVVEAAEPAGARCFAFSSV